MIQPQREDVRRGLILDLEYRGAVAAGGTWKDRSGHGYNVTCNGDMHVDKQGAHFDGTGDYGHIGTNVFEDTSIACLSGWINYTGNGTVQTIFSSSSPTSENVFIFEITAENKPFVQLWSGGVGGSNNAIQTTAAISNGRHHVLLICDGVSWKIYVDSALQSVSTLVGSNLGRWIDWLLDATRYARIGYAYINNGSYIYQFNGGIGAFRIYNRVLSSAEIAVLYNRGKWRKPA